MKVGVADHRRFLRVRTETPFGRVEIGDPSAVSPRIRRGPWDVVDPEAPVHEAVAVVIHDEAVGHPLLGRIHAGAPGTKTTGQGWLWQTSTARCRPGNARTRCRPWDPHSGPFLRRPSRRSARSSDLRRARLLTGAGQSSSRLARLQASRAPTGSGGSMQRPTTRRSHAESSTRSRPRCGGRVATFCPYTAGVVRNTQARPRLRLSCRARRAPHFLWPPQIVSRP